jgi:hypothetical protein
MPDSDTYTLYKKESISLASTHSKHTGSIDLEGQSAMAR